MEGKYTDELNVLIVVALLKAHGIRKVIVSPGTTNVTFVASLQRDGGFEMYSSADERSAAYMACGMAAESGEPVVLSCTGATASRNYIPGLTEAFYRGLPVLAVTSTQHTGRVGHNMSQVIDRSQTLKDMVRVSVDVPTIHCDEDQWSCEVRVNQAICELTRRGGGPAHINLATTFSPGYGVKELPAVRRIARHESFDDAPAIEASRVAVFVGSHVEWTPRLTTAVDSFCAAHSGAVLCDLTSNYRGRYRVVTGLVMGQELAVQGCCKPDLAIHIGGVSGGYVKLRPKAVWRVSPDGEIRDTLRRLTDVFEMGEAEFFEHYASAAPAASPNDGYLLEWRGEDAKLRAKIPELPFSNLWCAQTASGALPECSVLHLGIRNSLRSWDFFEVPEGVRGYSNVGGFGIDGDVSSLIGAALADPSRLYFGFVGDLAFFYDMNSLGNRFMPVNVRLCVVNNGRGTEFRNYHNCAGKLGEEADPFMAAAGHYGNKSPDLLRHYAEDLGFKYLTASDKVGFEAILPEFVDPSPAGQPVLLEVFTDSRDESEALWAITHLDATAEGYAKGLAKKALGTKGTAAVKKVMGNLGLGR